MTRLALGKMAGFIPRRRIGCFDEEVMIIGVVHNAMGLQHHLENCANPMLGRDSEASGYLDEAKESGSAAEHSEAIAKLRRLTFLQN